MSGPHLQWLANDEKRAALRRVWAEWFETYDLLLCPVMSTPAFPHDQSGEMFARMIDVNGEQVSYLNNVMWTGLIGIMGLPSAVPPIGRTASGLPVGVQVVAPYLRDRDAVHVAGLLGDLAGGYRPPPGF